MMDFEKVRVKEAARREQFGERMEEIHYQMQIEMAEHAAGGVSKGKAGKK